MATPKLATESFYHLQKRIEQAREQTDSLFALLRPDAIYERPIPERHRLIFYLGHLESFDWNLLGRDTFGLASTHPAFDKLFAFGIDPVDGQLPGDQPGDWPGVAEIQAYNARLRETIDAGVRAPSGRIAAEAAGASLDTLLNVAIEHRLMHAETLAYLLHQLPIEKKPAQRILSARALEAPSSQTVVPRMTAIPEGVATLGMPRDRGQFGWDNEFEELKVSVPRFSIGVFPVTNGEYLQFVRSGGYENKAHWSADDWQWLTAQRISHPLFWERSEANYRSGRSNENDGWDYRGMLAQIPLPLDWPVYVSHAEASAYARWAERALPSEAQWHRAAYGNVSGAQESDQMYPWGAAAPTTDRGNFDFAHWDPTAVNAHPGGQSAFGVHDLLGNGWEWTSTPFAPFPGFKPFPFYPGYSANFFDGKHFVMKGGSQRTAACMLRRSFRNWFQPHYPYVYAKFRTVEE
ncbi:MAG TPA: SUMF1/EgtB/PvdO family nonheme iron enzyme [Candidatus Acidoferrales bacterium]|nr:SUMF1/EgtB/PvdO family nonheme iron enzyme [Candidatus Acidoferrales bacterium]